MNEDVCFAKVPFVELFCDEFYRASLLIVKKQGNFSSNAVCRDG